MLKLLKLLQHCLPVRRRKRTDRRQRKSAPDIMVLVDAALEPRLLLSAATQADTTGASPEADLQNAESSASADATAVIDGADIADRVQDTLIRPDGDLTGSSTTVASALRGTISGLSDESFYQHVVSDDWAMVTTAPDPLMPLEYDNRVVLPESLPDGTSDDFSALPAHTTQPLVQKQRLVSKQPPAGVSTQTASRGAVAQPAITSASAVQRPTQVSASGVASKRQNSDGEAGTEPALVGIPTQDIPIAMATHVSATRSGNRTAASVGVSETVRLRPDALIEDVSFFAHTNPIGQLVFRASTVPAPVEFEKLLNSLVEFATVEPAATDAVHLSDWLSDQLTPDDESGAAETENHRESTDEYADQPVHHQEDGSNQRTRYTWSRIDVAGDHRPLLIILSENPPEPPEVTGILQQIKFNCNPRGPPRSEKLPASEFTRPAANAFQLQQLRYSIAPRGPSAASVQ